MGGARSLLRNSFTELLIVDLGGEGRGALIEENVFDIRTPVAIAFGIRQGPSDSACRVRHLRLTGTRQEKLKRLSTLTLDHITSLVTSDGLDPLVPRSKSCYTSWPAITDLFPWIRSGCKFQRTWPIGEVASVLQTRWKNLVEAVPRRRGPLLKEKDRTVFSRLKGLLDDSDLRPIHALDIGDQPEGIERYAFRSFDRQWAIADNRVAGRPAAILWRLRSSEQLFLTTLTSTKLGTGPVLTVTPHVPDLHHFSGRGARNVMPLFRDKNCPGAQHYPRTSRVPGSSRREPGVCPRLSRLCPRASRHRCLQRAVRRRVGRNG